MLSISDLDLSGVFPAMVTPFDEEGNVDVCGVEDLTEFLLEKGVHGLVPCGTTGEFTSMSREERAKVIETVVKKKNEIDEDKPVIAGAGASSTGETIKLVQEAEKIGADAALIVNPYYLKGGEKSNYYHYNEILKETEIPVVLYNIPQCTESYLERRVVEDLVENEKVIGIKDSSGDLPFHLELAEFIGKNTNVLCGNDEIAYEAMLGGCDGAILASANFIPEIWIKLWNEKGSNKALETKKEIQKITRITARRGGALPAKRALKHRNHDFGSTREPIKMGGSFSWEDDTELLLEMMNVGIINESEYQVPSEDDFEDPETDDGYYAHALSGEGKERVGIGIEIGKKGSSVGEKYVNLLARPPSNREALHVVLEPNLPTVPKSILMPGRKVKDLRHSTIIYGPVQAGVGKAIEDLKDELESILDLRENVLIFKAYISGVNMDRKTTFRNSCEASTKAIKKALKEDMEVV